MNLRVFKHRQLGSLPLRAPACWAFLISMIPPPLREIHLRRTIFSSQSPLNLTAQKVLLFAAGGPPPCGGRDNLVRGGTSRKPPK
jgi:hypothetical protein